MSWDQTSRRTSLAAARVQSAPAGVRPIGQFCTLQLVDTEGIKAAHIGGSRMALATLGEKGE